MSSFHYDFILSKRSSLAKVWLAAHWEKKLSKSQIFETNLQSIVKDILNPKMPIALRTSSHLLVGLVRIYSRKAKYLLQDCSDTLVNIKVAFRPGVSSLDKSAKKRKSVKEVLDCPLFITEKVDLLDQWIPEVSNAELDCTLNQSKIEEITLQEEPMKVSSLEDFFDDEGFGEMDVDASDVTEKNCSSMLERVYSFADSAYGTEEATLGETFSLTDCSDPFSSLTPVKDVGSSPGKAITSQDKTPKLLLDLDDELNHPEHHQTKEQCLRSLFEDQLETSACEDTLVLDVSETSQRSPPMITLEDTECDVVLVSRFDDEPSLTTERAETSITEEMLVLDPIEVAKEKISSTRKGRKRKLLIDEVISIERAVIFDNLKNASRLLKAPILAASSKRRMRQARKNESLLSSHPFLELSPALDKLFRVEKFRRFSTSTDVSGDIVIQPTSREVGGPSRAENGMKNDDFSHINMDEDNANAVDFDFSAQFIPLQDNEYSSDEESPTGPHYRTEFDSTQNTLTIEEETEQILPDENISEDKFCSYVETTVLQSRPEALRFLQIVGGDDGRELTRKTVARRFLKCLLMQRDARLSLQQDASFQDIFLRPGLKHASEKVVGNEDI